MNKTDELIRELRELLAVSSTDVIANMRNAVDEMLGPAEEHECWFEYESLRAYALRLHCSLCGKSIVVAFQSLVEGYNAMRRLTPGMLEKAAQQNAIYYADFRAAAAAMRKGASQSE